MKGMISLAMNGILLGVIAVLFRKLMKLRAKKKGAVLLDEDVIKEVQPHEVDEIFDIGVFGPTPRTEVAYIGRAGYQVGGAVSDSEMWVMAVLAKKSRNIFEFGTCSGRTAYILAKNSPADAKVTTLTLAPDQVSLYKKENADDDTAVSNALKESCHDRFFYQGTDVEAKTIQLFGDSKDFDETPFIGKMDMIFVDGSHAYSYVRSDSQKALKMLKDGGIILWHDFCGPFECEGVYKALMEIGREIPLKKIKDTMLVCYKKTCSDA